VLAFAGVIPVSAMVATSAYEALATPLTYLVVNRLKRTELVDVYDRDASFNPLPIGR
jgi:queuosine precursor transporter